MSVKGDTAAYPVRPRSRSSALRLRSSSSTPMFTHRLWTVRDRVLVSSKSSTSDSQHAAANSAGHTAAWLFTITLLTAQSSSFASRASER